MTTRAAPAARDAASVRRRRRQHRAAHAVGDQRRGVVRQPRRWIQAHAVVAALPRATYLSFYCHGTWAQDDPTASAAPLAWRERVDIIGALPGMLADLQHHRIAMLTPRVPLRRAETPERNAPCPCGSGRKFKKCCGA